MAVLAASFNTSMDSISLVLTASIRPGTPSTITRGSLLAFSERLPRIRIEPDSSTLEEDVMFIPATFPCRISVMSVEAIAEILSPFTLETAPVKSDFFIVPYPITTISSKFSESSAKMMLNIFLLPTLISCGKYPM